MTKEEKYAYWLQLSQYDIDTADSMYVAGRWFYVVYMCQQAIEKLCKGLYNFYIDDNMPKVHNIRFILSKLEASLSLDIDSEFYRLADTLSAYYLSNRYPDFAGKTSIYLDKESASDLLAKSKEAFAWLLTLKK
jgi:HEPN domain-containing protein